MHDALAQGRGQGCMSDDENAVVHGDGVLLGLTALQQLSLALYKCTFDGQIMAFRLQEMDV